MSKKFSLKKIKKEYLLIIVMVIIGIVFVFNSFKDIGKTSQTKSTNTTQEYIENLENKLCKCISKINGVKNVSVVISANASYKNVYLTQKEQINQNDKIVNTEEPVLIGGKPVIIQEEFPAIRGVLVVANGSNNISIKNSIVNACVTLLNVESTKVIVINGKNK